jgi:hypothetical protein
MRGAFLPIAGLATVALATGGGVAGAVGFLRMGAATWAVATPFAGSGFRWEAAAGTPATGFAGSFRRNGAAAAVGSGGVAEGSFFRLVAAAVGGTDAEGAFVRSRDADARVAGSEFGVA